ncbi:hypothetical protein DACRYDRAFT_70348, partial [Dacryopinax primogenitus]
MVGCQGVNPCGHIACGICSDAWIVQRKATCFTCREPAGPVKPLIPCRSLDSIIEKHIAVLEASGNLEWVKEGEKRKDWDKRMGEWIEIKNRAPPVAARHVQEDLSIEDLRDELEAYGDLYDRGMRRAREEDVDAAGETFGRLLRVAQGLPLSSEEETSDDEVPGGRERAISRIVRDFGGESSEEEPDTSDDEQPVGHRQNPVVLDTDHEDDDGRSHVDRPQAALPQVIQGVHWENGEEWLDGTAENDGEYEDEPYYDDALYDADHYDEDAPDFPNFQYGNNEEPAQYADGPEYEAGEGDAAPYEEDVELDGEEVDEEDYLDWVSGEEDPDEGEFYGDYEDEDVNTHTPDPSERNNEPSEMVHTWPEDRYGHAASEIIRLQQERRLARPTGNRNISGPGTPPVRDEPVRTAPGPSTPRLVSRFSLFGNRATSPPTRPSTNINRRRAPSPDQAAHSEEEREQIVIRGSIADQFQRLRRVSAAQQRRSDNATAAAAQSRSIPPNIIRTHRRFTSPPAGSTHRRFVSPQIALPGTPPVRRRTIPIDLHSPEERPVQHNSRRPVRTNRSRSPSATAQVVRSLPVSRAREEPPQ